MTADELQAWLEANHATAAELFVQLSKKGAGVESASWNDVVDECLRYGWIDGRADRVDDQRWTIRITPRRPRSIWSRKNLMRFGELRAEGRVTPAGLAVWDARDPERTDQYSHERETADLTADEWATFPPDARAFWDVQPPGYRKQALHWVTSPKRPETRMKHLADLVHDCANGLRIKLLRR